MKMKKWTDMAGHRPGCPHRGVAVYGTEEEMTKYYSGYCPGCNVPVKWQKDDRDMEPPAPDRTPKRVFSELPR